MEKLPKVGLPILVAIIILVIVIAKSAVTIDSGEAGVLFKTFGDGVVVDEPPMGEGFHVVAPWNKVYIYEVRQQELFEKMKVLSSNGLEIQIDASAWYQPVYNQLGNLHQSLGQGYLQRVIQPAIRSAARSVIGRYTPDDLYSTKRDAIQVEIFEETKKILDK
ncbi:MAG: prohibitin family protein, partial [Winogradskyella sp.]